MRERFSPPSYSERTEAGGRGRLGSWERRERWRVRGVREGLVVSAFGARSEVLEALREGGPTKRAGAGRRFVEVFFRGEVDDIVAVVVGWRLHLGGCCY